MALRALSCEARFRGAFTAFWVLLIGVTTGKVQRNLKNPNSPPNCSRGSRGSVPCVLSPIAADAGIEASLAQTLASLAQTLTTEI
jgi:hypothetical protein